VIETMSKLTKDEWASSRAKWERSTPDGFEWLAKEIGVSRPAVSKRAKAEKWTKKVTQKVTVVKEEIGYSVEKTVPATKTMGRPTIYQESFINMAYQLCFLGATDQQLANALNVSEQTINTWKKKHPDFLESINRGKLYADALVAHALYKTALGQHVTIEHRETKQGITLKTTRTVLPNFNAQRFWLTNRQPKLWKK